MPLDWTDDQQETYDAFHDAVNMAPKELEEWLGTDESKSVGATHEGEAEAVGHKSGKRIVEIKRTTKDDLTESDLDHMQTVVGYVHRHLAQGPEGSAKETPWRYSLMNWGHDPCKDDGVDCS